MNSLHHSSSVVESPSPFAHECGNCQVCDDIEAARYWDAIVAQTDRSAAAQPAQQPRQSVSRPPLTPPSHASGPSTLAWDAVCRAQDDARSLVALRDAEHALAATWDALAFSGDPAPTMADRDWAAAHHADADGITDREAERLSIDLYTLAAAEVRDALAERYPKAWSAWPETEVIEGRAGGGHGYGVEWEG